MKKILMACANYWTSPFQVGSHHLARGFADAGWTVGFVSDPISPLHILGGDREGVRERLELYRAGGTWDLEDHVWAYVPGTVLPPYNMPLLRSQAVWRSWHKATCPSLLAQVKKNGFGEVDVIYCDSVRHAGWLKHIRGRTSIYRLADNTEGFKRNTRSAALLESELANSVDVVVYTAVNLEPYIKRLGPRRRIHLPNGVDFEHFRPKPRQRPSEYESIPRPIAAYVGAMEEWFDYELINAAVVRLPHVSFVLIGDGMAREKIHSRPNVYVLGRRSFNDLPKYLHYADVGIIPFNVQRYPTLVHSIHPLKLYEYMACGLPVVSVRWGELENIGSPAVLCDTADAFMQAIAEAVSGPQDKEAFINFAKKHDWSKRVACLLAL